MTAAGTWFHDNPLYVGVHVISVERRIACGLPIEDRSTRQTGRSFGVKAGRPIEIRPRVLPRCRPVSQYDLSGRFLNRYDDVTDVCDQTGFPEDDLLAACRARLGRLGGYIWKFA